MGCQADSPPPNSIENNFLNDYPASRSEATINSKREIVSARWQAAERNLGSRHGKHLTLVAIALPIVFR